MRLRLFGTILGTFALAITVLAAYQATTPANAVEDHRPFGKYLVRVCELGVGCYDPSTACKPSCPSAADSTNQGSSAPATKSTKKSTKSTKAAAKECPFCSVSKQPVLIKIEQVGCSGTVPVCNATAQYPLQVGQAFYIKATTVPPATTPTPVLQTVDGGPAVAAGPSVGGIQAYTVTGDKPITIKATRASDGTYLAAPAASIVLQTADSPSRDCYGLYKGPVISSDQPDITAIAALAGNPVPFLLATQGTGTILIYATRWPYEPEQRLLDQITSTLNGPLGTDAGNSFGIKAPTAKPTPFERELRIAHAAALGDPAARITALASSIFSAQNVGSTPGIVRIKAADTPTCKDWKSFLSSIRTVEWSVYPAPQMTKLWHLSADDASKAMGTLFPAPSSGSGSGGGSPSGSGAPSGTGSTPGGSGGPAPGGSPNATISVNQPPGSKVEIKTDTTPCVVAGLAFGNSSSCAPTSSSTSPTGAPAAPAGSGISGPNPVSPPRSIATASIGIPAGTPPAGLLPQSPNDMLIYGNPTPGDDAQIEERNRILALLDLPRPEMIINAWVIQNSTTDPRAMGELSQEIRTLVEHYNESLERMVLEAYKSVSEQMLQPDYFNQAFLHYVSDQFVAERDDETASAEGGDETSAAGEGDHESSAERFLNGSSVQLADSKHHRTEELGICKKDQYCLGYRWLFHPAKPRLTDLLLALIAAEDPFAQVLKTINEVQQPSPPDCCRPDKGQPSPGDTTSASHAQDAKTGQAGATPSGCVNCFPDQRANIEFNCMNAPDRDAKDRCFAIQEHLALHRPPPPKVVNYLDPETDCTVADEWGILRSQFTELTPVKGWRPRVHLACFARTAKLNLANAGLARAAVADFLFQYKQSQQYPHEFSAYDLNRSASTLNSILSPLIEAFNRDVVAFQTYMRTDLEYEVEVANRGNDRRCCVKRLFGLDKPSFFNDGIVSVRTLSGQAVQVNATSQSFLDASKAPSLSDLISAMGGSGNSNSTSPLAAVLGTAATQAPVSLLASVLSSYQKTYAQIGRQLQLQVVPRSLATASAAEISVYMKAGDPASPPTFVGGPASAQQQNISEVSDHEVTTRIRIDSVKLFELSSYSAVLQRARSKFPLLPPFVELPYIGTVAGIPMPGAKEYHESTAIISAMVVPTAADLGYGLRFWDDLLLAGPGETCSFDGQGARLCQVKSALSQADLHAPISPYHQAMILCLITQTAPGRVPPTSFTPESAPRTLSENGLPPATTTGQSFFQIGPRSDKAEKQSCQDLTFKRFPN